MAGIVTAAILMARRNPLAKGLMELSEELTALEAEMGAHFWADAINRIGSGNIHAEYSLNIGGIPELENITVGVDGKTRRNMEEKLFDTEVDISIVNAKIAEAQLSGTEDTLYLQIPSVWEGSVVLNTSDIDGQWNDSAMKKSLQLLTGEKLETERQIDVDFFTAFTVESLSIADFLEENREALQELFKKMKVMEIDKAEREGMLRKGQAEALREVRLKNGEGESIETTCCLVVLPEEELRVLWNDIQDDIRLNVYLDSEKRIVRIGTLPEENLAVNSWEREFAVNLTGKKSVTGRMEFEIAGKDDGRELAETIILDKEIDRAGAYRVKWDGSLREREHAWDFSLEGSILGEKVSEGGPFGAGVLDDKEGQRGVEAQDSAEERQNKEEQAGAADRLSIDIDHFVMKSESEVIGRGSGSVVFTPLDGKIQMPEGVEHRIAEMGELETALFLMECTGKVKENYSGYLRFWR